MTDTKGSFWRKRRFEIALAAAALVHVGLLAVAPPQAAPGAKRSVQEASLEIDLLPWVQVDVVSAPRPTPVAEVGEGSVEPVAVDFAVRSQYREPAALASEALPAARGPEAELSATLPPEGAPPEAAAASRKTVRLFLGRDDLADIARRNPSRTREVRVAPEAPPASVGLLTEGLHELDAEKGLSGSSPAVSASYRAARLGPNVGTAVFEIRTDASGSVTTVRVVGNAGDAAWSSVAADLLARLKDHLLRLPKGAKGLVTRLRIDRGELAQDLSERGRTKRGVAVGQDHHPKDLGWDESTQGSTRPGRLAPSLGVSSDDLRTSVKTRVRLLSQQSL